VKIKASFALRVAGYVGYSYRYRPYALSTYTSVYQPTTCCTTTWLKPSEVE